MSALSRKLDEASGPRCYFACANNVSAGAMSGREILGLGISRLIKKDPAPLAEALRPPDDGRWMFSVRFAPEQAASAEWQDFGAALFWRPQQWIEATDAHNAPRASPLKLAEARAAPMYDEVTWTTAFAAAQRNLTAPANELQKVVLARPFDFDAGLKPLSPTFDAQAHHAHRFAFILDEQRAFVGASPELLARTEGQTLFTEALAGTATTGADEGVLVNSPKQRHEHDLVVAAVEQSLAGYPTQMSGPQVRRHGDVMHLATTFSATGVRCPWTEAARLAPTPAVCGTPREAAYPFITAHEGFDRGMYAGAVGFCDGENVFIAVALRCALVHAGGVRVYAGGGLVDQSEREQEQTELLNKSALWRRWCT